MKKLKQILAAAMTAAYVFMPVAIPATVVAAGPADVFAQVDPRGNACIGVTVNDGSGCDDADSSPVYDIITTIINLFSIVVGAVSVIMIIIGGFRYITSGGDSGNVTSAKNTILYAIVGLVIVIFAQTIVRFVLGSLPDPVN